METGQVLSIIKETIELIDGERNCDSISDELISSLGDTIDLIDEFIAICKKQNNLSERLNDARKNLCDIKFDLELLLLVGNTAESVVVETEPSHEVVYITDGEQDANDSADDAADEPQLASTTTEGPMQ